MVGATIGSYRITQKLGEGGMGVVYEAEHTVMGRKAVVKMLRSHLSGDKVIVKRFFNEARAAARIRHPGIVDVYDVGFHDDGSAYIVMDRLEGESLAQRRRRLGKLDPDQAVWIVRQVLGALSAAHGGGIVHRDLKPDNIFLVADPELPTGERAKILDFGIAKLAGEGGGHGVMTQTGAMMGTPVYMSPEQCRGAGEVDHRTDLYAMGVILFELLTGRPPFSAAAPGELMVAHLRDTAPSIRSIDPSIAEELDEIVAVLLAKEPDKRFASCDALIQALDTATGGKFSTGKSLPPPATSSAPPPALDPYAATALGTGPETEPDPATEPAKDTTLGAAASQRMSARRGGSSRAVAIAIGGAVLVGAAVAVVFAVQSGDDGAAPGPPGPDQPVVPTAVVDAPADAAPACATPRLVLDPSPKETGANFRREPSGGNDTIVRELANCTEVCELGRDGAWVRLRAPNGDTGYLHHTRVSPVGAYRCAAGDLPPIALDAVERKRETAARRFNKLALKLHRAQDYAAAIDKYKEAVRADPGHLMTRYNLSCAYNMSGQTDRGLDILAQFKEAGCPVCLGRLIRARSDREWASARDNPRFRELTGDVVVEQPSAFEMGKYVAAALSAGDMVRLKDYVHPRNVLTVGVREADCDRSRCEKKKKLRGFDPLREWFTEHPSVAATEDPPSCSGMCCRYARADAGELHLREVCTSVDSGSVRTISSLTFERPARP